MRYASDVSDQQWQVLRVYFENRSGVGRPQRYPLREIVNAIFYVLKTGCQWRMLPKDFPRWDAVYFHFNRWRKDGTWHVALRELHKLIRVLSGRSEQPTAGSIDSQSVKSKRGV